MRTIVARLRPAARRAAPLLMAALAALASVAPAGAAPAPLDGDLFAFPGSMVGPGSAISAGTGLADRWLGDEPHANPAVAPGFRVTVSPSALRFNRQDLAARNRNFSETTAFFDGAGASVVAPPVGPFTLALYAYQPVLRFEETSFIQGLATPGPEAPPATVQTHASAREARAGGAVSAAFALVRVGAAVEWTRREDRYRRIRQSGDPEAGTTEVSFAGDGFGAQLGVRIAGGDSASRPYTIGAALRLVPALPMDGIELVDTQAQFSEGPTTLERRSGVEGGVSARVALGPSFAALAAVGARGAQRWDGYDVEAGGGWEWKIGGELHDVRDPWTLRFGGGMERQSSVPESRASVMAIGFGWRFADVTLDVGLMRRTVARADRPNSFDDRAVLSISVPR